MLTKNHVALGCATIEGYDELTLVKGCLKDAENQHKLNIKSQVAEKLGGGTAHGKIIIWGAWLFG